LNRLRQNNWKTLAQSLAGLLAILFFLVLIPGLAQAEDAKEPLILPGSDKAKHEVIYGKLDASGAVEQIYVVNHFQADQVTDLIDYGDYSSVIQLTGDQAPILDGDQVYLDGIQGPYYYQGNLMSRDLPWIIGLDYQLDGEAVSPQELSGASGSLEMTLDIRQNLDLDPFFFDHYAMQIAIPLDPDRVILRAASPGFVLALAGTEHQLNYVVLPGQETAIKLVMDVEDFAMGPLTLAGVAMSFDLDLSELEESLAPLDELSSGIAQLADGSKELQAGYRELMTAFREIKEGSGQLADGGKQIEGGVKELADGVSELVEAGQALKEGSELIFGALDQIFDMIPSSEDLEGIELPDFTEEDIERLRDTLEFLRELEAILELLQEYEDELEEVRDDLQEIIEWLREQEAPDMEDVPVSPDGWKDLLEGLGVEPDQGLDNLYETLARLSQIAARLEAMQDLLDALSDLLAAIPDLDMTVAEVIEELSWLLDQAEEMLELLIELGPTLAGLGDMGENLDDLKAGYSEFRQGLRRFIDEGIGGLDQGLQGTDSEPGLVDGLLQFTGGVVALDQGLGRYYREGMVAFGKGLDQLVQGAGTMKEETGDLRGLFEEGIKEKLSEFTNEDFQAVSFVSEKNTEVLSVQFVMMTAEIPPA
jgi:X-X-X-Leu-X-X-Gly heptad repeat protein